MVEWTEIDDLTEELRDSTFAQTSFKHIAVEIVKLRARINTLLDILPYKEARKVNKMVTRLLSEEILDDCGAYQDIPKRAGYVR